MGKKSRRRTNTPTTVNLKGEDSTATRNEYRNLQEVEQKIEAMAIDRQTKKSLTEAESAEFARPFIEILKHASTCDSKCCSSSKCTKMKTLLQHISSCRQGKSGGCIECKETLNLIGIHTFSCKTKNCKVPRCEFVKEKRLHKMQIEQSNTVKSTAATATVKEDDTKTANDILEQKIENVIITTDQGDDEKWKPYVTLLEHASLCKSSKCAPNCAKMKESLQHNIASCRQRNCMSCKHVICLVRYHAISCKTNNCKVPMCNLVKEISRKLENEKSVTDDTGPTPAQAPEAASDIAAEHIVTSQGIDQKIKALMNEDESIKAYRIAREQSIDDFTEAFEEFMLWSLSDEADLNPKKFAKQASGIAKLLIAGEISIETLLEKRVSTIASIEVQTKEYEYQKSLKLLLAGMKFESPKYQDEFTEQLDEALSRRNWDILGKPPILIFLYDSFQEVLSKWSSSSKLCLNDELIFITTSKIDFDESFTRMLQNVIRDRVKSKNKPAMDNEKLFQKYYLHPSARKEYLEKENIYAEKLLSSVLALYEESHRCWRCNRLHGKGIETKALICAGCECATYCSRECQIENWKQGDLEQKHILNSHKEKCKGIDETWSAYQIRKKSVGRAHLKGRILTKSISINGIEKECFLRPCEPLDYFLCTTSYESNENALCASMDIFYENLATLACGGKHLIFGNETISSQLEEQIRTHYEGVLSEFDPGTLKDHEISAMARTGKMLQYKESYLAKYDLTSVRSSLSVDRFITLYICFEPLGLGKRILGENVNKFEIEKFLLRELKSCQVKNE